MNKIVKYFAVLIIIVAIVIIGAVVYLNTSFPAIELNDDIRAELTEENVQRGEYLVNSVNACFHCHSGVDYSHFSGKIIAGTEGAGGRFYPEEVGFPGNFYASNITPHNLGDWTDAEIYRAIASGVSKSGSPLFPLMPYHSYKYLTQKDAEAIIAYLRTINSIEKDYPPSEFNFPFSLILRTIPIEPEPMEDLDKDNPVEYGRYLVNIAGCADCHTQKDGGKKVEGMDFAGGFAIPMETGGVCRAANITPDIESGIGSWTKDDFIRRFKYYMNNDSLFVNKGEFNSEMPWTVYSGMTEADLGAIYDYLQTVKPVKNHVQRFSMEIPE
jgi:hypothetical protein